MSVEFNTPESARIDAKSVTLSSKSVTYGRPHDSDDSPALSSGPALALMPMRRRRHAQDSVGEGGGYGPITIIVIGVG